RQLDRKYAFVPSAYVEAEQILTDKFSIRYVLRFSAFYRLGASMLNTYENNQLVIFNEQQQVYEKADPIGSRRYNRHETIKKFGNIEPRFALSYALTDDQSLKFGYNRTVQYLQLISNTSSPTPLDV